MDETVRRAVADADQTDEVAVARGALAQTGALMATWMPGSAALLVADEKTWAAAGDRTEASLREAGVPLAEPLVFPGSPTLYASLDNAARIREAIVAADQATGTRVTPVAVGAGTLNDLVKMAAHELERRYVVVGTAASMDGYTGAGAPMSSNGVKITVNCTAPQVVVFDLEVTARAPQWMVASGYGDLAAKIPGGADWILADAAGVEPIDEHVWSLVQSGVRDALAHPTELAAGAPEAFEGLVNGLVLSGLAMQVHGGTRPASGAEHYFSHIWELDHLGADDDPPLSHGFKVAIGTLAMLAFYEPFMARGLADLDVDAAVDAWPSWQAVEADIRATFTGPLADHAVKETKVKYVDPDGLRARLETLKAAWPRTRERLAAQLVPAADFQAQLRAAGAPSRPQDIGLSVQQLRETFPKAMYYRSRYTVLDVAREAGWFDELVEQTFAPGGIWG
ncbi:glycerol-1-phosphate dehydrogenase [NAD(P)+] [Luteococcus japonicus]|uniref:Glycerol-1-phosphate dehydrogenase [NAD(P)+] n=2 Tax=Propionibacteriaceae TaxID=31957 RepID=A0A3N1ZY25_9ACTN|nr:glycerol-1-phosphate dehydrogenase [NAD(P)+] [Luteococcus japonicus]